MKVSRRGFLGGIGGLGAAVAMPGSAFVKNPQPEVEQQDQAQRIHILPPYLVARAGQLVYCVDQDGHLHEAHAKKNGPPVAAIDVYVVRRMRKVMKNLVRYAIVRDDGIAVLQIYTEPSFNYSGLEVPVHLRLDEPVRPDRAMTSWIQTDGISLWWKARKLRSTLCGGIVQRNWRDDKAMVSDI